MGLQKTSFWAKTAPDTYQKLMNFVLSGSTGKRCFVYLRDIVMYVKFLAEHNIKLREVLYKPRRTKFAVGEVGISPKRSKVPRPTNN